SAKPAIIAPSLIISYSYSTLPTHKQPFISSLPLKANMIKQFVLLVLLAVASVNAWSFKVWTEDNEQGKMRWYHDFRAGNGCYNIDTDITSERVGSISFCSMAWTRCSISLHSETGCNGQNLGSATAAAPIGEWHVHSTSYPGSFMKSFRIQGCKGIPVAGDIDCTTCTYDPKN
ncbi:hypothetical protein BGX28_002717, partial [Mortierella sp. GBA30]